MPSPVFTDRQRQLTLDFDPGLLVHRTARDQALGQVAELLQQLPAMLAAAGVGAPVKGRGR